MVDNFDYKKYLKEGKLFKEENQLSLEDKPGHYVYHDSYKGGKYFKTVDDASDFIQSQVGADWSMETAKQWSEYEVKELLPNGSEEWYSF